MSPCIAQISPHQGLQPRDTQCPQSQPLKSKKRHLSSTLNDRNPLKKATKATVQEQALSSASQNGRKQPGLIFGPSERQAWDSKAVSNPVVRCYWGDNEHRWMMWYNGNSADTTSSGLPKTNIGLATSTDGVRWQRDSNQLSETPSSTTQDSSESSGGIGRVLGPNEDWWWHDTRHVKVSDVQIFSSDAVNTGVGVYWMFYSGGSFEEAEVPAEFPVLEAGSSAEGLRTRIGLAMSQDGRNWARIEADHHTGALFDAGEGEDWDECLNGAPQVLALGRNDMRMYYHSYLRAEQRWAVGLATSRDGFKWQKRGPVFEGSRQHDFDAKGAAAHHVVRDPDARRFVMFYEAAAKDDSRTIGVAVSKDGLKGWKCLDAPVLTASANASWDSGNVGAPCAVSMEGGKWRLYYSGREKGESLWQSIGLAITDIDNAASFEGIQIGFKRISSNSLQF